MYDPTIGRWLSEDPISFAGGDLNLYRYVDNNPENWTDPEGNQKQKVPTKKEDQKKKEPTPVHIIVTGSPGKPVVGKDRTFEFAGDDQVSKYPKGDKVVELRHIKERGKMSDDRVLDAILQQEENSIVTIDFATHSGKSQVTLEKGSDNADDPDRQEATRLSTADLERREKQREQFCKRFMPNALITIWGCAEAQPITAPGTFRRNKENFEAAIERDEIFAQNCADFFQVPVRVAMPGTSATFVNDGRGGMHVDPKDYKNDYDYWPKNGYEVDGRGYIILKPRPKKKQAN